MGELIIDEPYGEMPHLGRNSLWRANRCFDYTALTETFDQFATAPTPQFSWAQQLTQPGLWTNPYRNGGTNSCRENIRSENAVERLRMVRGHMADVVADTRNQQK